MPPETTRVRRSDDPVTALLARLTLAGMSPAMTVEGCTTAAVFAADLLVPALCFWQAVVVDNVGAHRPERMYQLITAAGCGSNGIRNDGERCGPARKGAMVVKMLVKNRRRDLPPPEA
jgi:hypothetical protein